MAWQQGGGYYPGQQGPPPPGFYTEGPGYPTQGSGYPPQGPGYPPPPGAGYPPPPGAGYPPGSGYPPTATYPPPTAGYPGAGFGTSGEGIGGQGGNMYNDGYVEEGRGSNFAEFSDKSIRRGFIRKVYGILMCQLAVTLAILSVFVFNNNTKQFVKENYSLVWVALGVTLVCMIVMACCGEVRRKAPTNFIFLGIFTLAESFLLGCISAVYAPFEVFAAIGICAFVTLGLTLFAFQTKIDFTVMGGILFVSTLILMIFGIVVMFWPGKIITLVYSSFGALLFSIYIIYDTQIMMGGNHKYAISPEEYIFAALNLYLDIVQLFLYILTIIGASRD